RTGDASVYVKQGSAHNDAGARAKDDVNGNLTPQITTVGATIDTSVAGTYTVTYNVSDKAGNAATEVTRTVIVDGGAPVITRTGRSGECRVGGSGYNGAGAAATEDVNGGLTCE